MALRQILGLTFLLVGSVGCKMFEPHEPGAQGRTAKELKSVKNLLTAQDKSFLYKQPEFAFRMARAMDFTTGQENECFSPFGAEHSLALVLNGAQDKSFDACAQVMGLQDPRVDKLNEANSKVLDILASQPDKPVQVANSMWNILPIRFNKTFQLDMDKYYTAEVRKLGSAGIGARDQLNDWVSHRTDGAFPELIKDIHPKETTILLNAVSFRGLWDEKFQPAEMKEFVAPRGRVSVATLSGTRNARAVFSTSFRALTLPYKGGTLRWTAVVASPGTKLSSLLSPAVFSEIVEKSVSAELYVSFPKFSVSSETDLVPVVTKMGGGRLFTTDNDFGLMSHEMRYSARISGFRQFTKFETDETGSTGASASIVESSKSESEPREFLVDRPFLFLVWEEQSRTILFMGSVQDPSR